MTQSLPISATFSYRAQTTDGQPITGTIDAADATDASRRLMALHLQVLELQSTSPPARGRAIGADDFLAFNQQLAQLVGANLPVEQGLRLIAQESRHGPLRRTIEALAADLDSGKSLPQAVETRRNQFPPLYASLLDAGIRSGNLSGILLNLGRHLTLVRRLKSSLWRTMAYPLLVAIAFLAVLWFILARVIPQVQWMYMKAPIQPWMLRSRPTTYNVELPVFSQLVFGASDLVAACPIGWILGGIAAVVLLAWIILRLVKMDRSLAEGLALMLPMIGPVFKRSFTARWCDAVGLATEAGVDLPAAIQLAENAIGSPRLRLDGDVIIDAISRGEPVGRIPRQKILPATVMAAIDLASTRGDLPQTLRGLAEMYQEQAELRLASIQLILTPLLLLLMGLTIGILMTAILLPILHMLSMF